MYKKYVVRLSDEEHQICQEVVKKLEELYQQADKFPSFLKNTREEQKKDDKVVYIQAFLKRQEDEEKK